MPALHAVAEDRDQGPGLTYHQALSLRLTPVESLPGNETHLQFSAHNELLLRGCIALQDHHEAEARDGENMDLLRLELKLDLVLSCLQQLLVSSSPHPAPVPITLTPEGIGGQASDLPSLVPLQGEFTGPTLVQIELYINPLVPTPLTLFGELLPPEGSGDSWEIVFRRLGEPQRQLLEKLIFRYHRQSVAMELRG